MTTIVKVGGSLFHLPDLGTRLARFLRELSPARVVIVPGGGPGADHLRQWDTLHQLGEEASHWLALRAVSLNAHFLASFLPDAPIVSGPGELDAQGAQTVILDGYAFARADEGRPGSLPHSWDATSDSLAARAAVVFSARRLILLKSAPLPGGLGWEQAARLGIVDRHFATVAGQASDLRIDVIDFRALPSP